MAKKKTSSKKQKQEHSVMDLATMREIANHYADVVRRVTDAAQENEGIIPDELLEELDAVEGDLRVKGGNYAVVFETLDRQIAHAKEVKKRADGNVKRAEAEKREFSKLAFYGLDRAGVTEAGESPFQIAIQENPVAVDDARTIVDEVPDDYCDWTVTFPAYQYGIILRLITFIRGQAWSAREEDIADFFSDCEQGELFFDCIEQLTPQRWSASRKLRKNDAKKAYLDAAGADGAVPGLAVKRDRKLVVK
jgi:hypothetical protein